MTIARAHALPLAFVLSASVVYFYQGGGWNQNSRLDLTRAIVETGSLRITPFHGNTGDKAKVGGDYYCDKAPGLSLTAVPPYAVCYFLVRAVWRDPSQRPSLDLLLYLCTVMTSGLAAVLLGLALFQLARRWGCGPGGGVFVAVAAILASPMWAYATLFWSHVVAAACLVGAFAAAQALAEQRGLRRDLLLGAAVGLGGGWATVVEYPAAPAALILALLAVAELRGSGRSRWLAVGGALVLAALACLAVLMAYHAAAFGAPFRIGYQTQVNFKPVAQLFHAPSLATVEELLTGRFRGLLPLAPVLAVAPVGFVLALRRGQRAPAIAAAAIAAYYILMNASYEGWFGGWNYGPRDLAPAIPFLALFLAPIWARGPRALRMLLVAAALWGAGSSLMAVSTMVQPPDKIKRPVDDLLWPAFRTGRLSLNPMGYHDSWADADNLLDPGAHHPAWNVGQRVGLDGHASLAPLYAAWLAGAVWLWRARRDRPPSFTPPASDSPAALRARPPAGRRRARRGRRGRRALAGATDPRCLTRRAALIA